MDIKGKFLKKSDIQTFESGFQKQDFYMDCSSFSSTTGEKIENILRFQVSGSRMDGLLNVQKGDEIRVSFNLKGRTYEKKDGSGKGHIQNAEAWKIENLTITQPTQASPSTQPPVPAEFADDDDDLPF